MRLIRFGAPGEERAGAMIGETTALDLGEHLPAIDHRFWAGGGFDQVHRLIELHGPQLTRVDTTQVRLGPPIAKPYQVLCVGLNYADHAVESGMAIPDEPIIFNKAPGTVVGPNDDVLLPIGGEKTDWEVELAVVIGRQARYLPDETTAAACIGGYAISNDVSERAFQLERGGQWVKGKSCETFNPLGPWLVSPDEIADPGRLDMELSVNGERVQSGSTSTMVFGVPYLIWYLSQFLVLEPGDVVNTGTPPGVGLGMDPPRYLKEGDVMELRIPGLGAQRQVVRAATL